MLFTNHRSQNSYIGNKIQNSNTINNTTDMFSIENSFEILLEAHDSNNSVVGEAKAGGLINPATGTLSLKPGDNVQVTMKMQMDFEGKFKLKALHPTTYTVYCQIDLATDYSV